ncbi:MAG: N-acetylneuraminate synthase family protein [Solidesulfovibrio sp.]|uniref:N-acetylneuraminate synthase family protein n=1 Tax=Solidesulfovibrio sp. TaxID=2910990 RepID=UPI002B1EBDB7|nr:N-acetylneuraminate synthase family protein [Solidesulfovibrio sp.]MEA4855674.1 N-acetylneuraminate synthase family protein [Solidesulfovibrio sp.]
MPPLFVAEISSNHNQDIDRCLRFVDVAAAIGCGAVKFQLFTVADLFAPEILAASARHRARRAYELPVSFLPAIAGRCRQRGVLFGCTPFSLAAVEQLAGYVDFLKIASYELLWPPLGAACAATGLPVMLATGLADLAEVAGAVENLRRAGCPEPTLLHCVSAYPLPPGEANLAAIDSLRRAFGLPVGWSDHSRCPGVIHRAVHRFGAEVVELHLDLEGEGREYGAGHCWLPGELAECIRDVAAGLAADGDGIKACAPCEAPDRDWRADPHDGLRPLRRVRAGFTGDNGGAS